MSILEKINSPADVKRLSEKELRALAGEIRQTITETAAKNGGHLASNLGSVDAEIALHRVFSCPDDTIVFDVGHQAYAHKLITGRREIFSTLRQSGGMSGFTNRTESEYDTVTAGHSGTALSTAVGIAEANRLAGRKSYTVAVIGDGSFTNGMVYEALNQLCGKDLRLILLLNDNTMSISKNVGGMPEYLSRVRTSEKYFTAKLKTKRAFMHIPLIGKALVTGTGAVKDFVKRTLGAETWFESLGLDYIGPVNGNNIHRLTAVLEEAKSKEHPVVVHITTKKGLGFPPAEEHPEKFHSTSPFRLDDGAPLTEKARTFTDEASDILVNAADNDKGITAVTAAMADGCGLSRFAKQFQDRFFDVGIAEEHAVTFASGLSLGGHADGVKPVLVMYSTFSQRVFDQLWHDFCLQNKEKNDLSLTLMLSHAGFVQGDGVTHQGIYDVALLSRLPDVTIYSPDTFADLRKYTSAALSSKGLTVVRYPKSGENVYGDAYTEKDDYKEFVFGGENSGKSEVVVTYGRVAKNAIAAAKRYAEEEKLRVTVAVLGKIHPLPGSDEFVSLIKEADKVTFVEEGIRSGGIGEALATRGLTKAPMKIIAVDDGYIRAGSIEEIERRLGLDERGILSKLREAQT